MTANLSALVRRLAGTDPADATDADLLGRFVSGRDAAAFAELVRRHGPAVFGACRRGTGCHHLAEDAFQAVFVVLAAKAGCVRPPAALGGWLLGVARRTALRARTMRDRRRRRERLAGRPEAVFPEPPDDLAAVLDAEIARLPAAQRAAVALCELGGRSRAAAAAELGVVEGTLSSRLAAARKALAARLRSRGLALPAALGPAVLAAVPPDLLARAAAAAATPHLAPAAVAALSHGVLRTMFIEKLKLVPLLLGVAAAVGLAAGFAGSQPPPPVPAAKAADPPKAAPKVPRGPNRLFVWRKAELVALDPDGGNETVVLAAKAVPGIHPNTFAVSPDGTRVAVVGIKDVTPGEQNPRSRLYVCGLGADAPPAAAVEVGDAGTVAWSADGAALAVCSFTDGPNPADIRATHAVYDLAAKTTAPGRLPADHILTDWSRDGRFFLTTRLGADKGRPTEGLWVMNRDGTEHKRLTDPGKSAAFGRFSPDGKRVLGLILHPRELTPREKKELDDRGAAPGDPRVELALADATTGKVTPVRDVPLNAEVMGYCWSPDGRRIAYVWREEHPPGTDPNTETTSSLTVCDPDGANQRTIFSEKGRLTQEIVLGGVDWR